jgi:hypothetical protein
VKAGPKGPFVFRPLLDHDPSEEHFQHLGHVQSEASQRFLARVFDLGRHPSLQDRGTRH